MCVVLKIKCFRAKHFHQSEEQLCTLSLNVPARLYNNLFLYFLIEPLLQILPIKLIN